VSHRSLRFACGVLLALAAPALLLAGRLTSAPAASTAPVVRVATLAADIDPVTANWIVGQIHAAEDAHDAALVLQLDTPGGDMSSLDKITAAELRARRLPVIVYVAPAGARAASAGFFVLQASDIAAMAPISNTGSATPIDSSGSNIGGDLRNKILADAEARIRNLAALHGRNAELAQKAVHPRDKTCPRCPLNWTANEALRKNLIDVVAPNIDVLLQRIDGRKLAYKDLTVHVAGATIQREGLSLGDRLLDVLVNPDLVYLLFILGIVGIIFELTHPGIVLPGLLGGVSLILGLLGLTILPFSWAGVVLLVGGLLLLALEAHVPAHGAFAAVGALGVILGGLILFRVSGSPYRVHVPLVIAVGFALVALVLLVMQKTISLRRSPPTTGKQELVGALARVLTPLAPAGQVFVHGERWAAVVDDPAVDGGSPLTGDWVRVLRVDGLLLHVERAPAPADEVPQRPSLDEPAPSRPAS
jgi:membrane-bound serine protease (ClpP class)